MPIKKNKKSKVLLALSGGVDSAVAAILLKEKGYEVSGIFLKLFNGQEEKQAKKIAKKLAIPFFVLDAKKEFKREIINYFIKEYENGKTPNPCVQCNKKIKFGFLLGRRRYVSSLSLWKKFDFLATGHYVRVQQEGDIPECRLRKAKDKEKDQSYFLYNLNQSQLKKILFPIGNYTKKEVRSLAKKFNLPIFENSESQEICFIKGETNDFLKQHIKQKPGKIVDVSGKIIGGHQGLFLYTIGQRKSIGIGGIGPYYVCGKDFKNNNLIVTNNFKSPALFKKSLIAKNVNWISKEGDNTYCRLRIPIKIKAQIRYRQEAIPAEIKKTKNKNKVEVVFSKSQRAIAPGQSVVFYKNKEVLGGGIIES